MKPRRRSRDPSSEDSRVRPFTKPANPSPVSVSRAGPRADQGARRPVRRRRGGNGPCRGCGGGGSPPSSSVPTSVIRRADPLGEATAKARPGASPVAAAGSSADRGPSARWSASRSFAATEIAWEVQEPTIIWTSRCQGCGSLMFDFPSSNVHTGDDQTLAQAQECLADDLGSGCAPRPRHLGPMGRRPARINLDCPRRS